MTAPAATPSARPILLGSRLSLEIQLDSEVLQAFILERVEAEVKRQVAEIVRASVAPAV